MSWKLRQHEGVSVQELPAGARGGSSRSAQLRRDAQILDSVGRHDNCQCTFLSLSKNLASQTQQQPPILRLKNPSTRLLFSRWAAATPLKETSCPSRSQPLCQDSWLSLPATSVESLNLITYQVCRLFSVLSKILQSENIRKKKKILKHFRGNISAENNLRESVQHILDPDNGL